MSDQVEDWQKELNDWLRASAGSFDFWDNPLDAEWDKEAPAAPVAAPVPIRELVDDYDEAMLLNAGSLGIVEL